MLPTWLQLVGYCYATGTGASVDPAHWRVQLIKCGTSVCADGINLPAGYQASYPACQNVTVGPSCALSPIGARLGSGVHLQLLPVSGCGGSLH